MTSLPHLSNLRRDENGFSGFTDEHKSETADCLAEIFNKDRAQLYQNPATSGVWTAILIADIHGRAYGKQFNKMNLKTIDKFMDLIYVFYNLLDIPVCEEDRDYLFRDSIKRLILRAKGHPIGKGKIDKFFGRKQEQRSIPVPKKGKNRGKHNRFYRR